MCLRETNLLITGQMLLKAGVLGRQENSLSMTLSLNVIRNLRILP